MDALKTVKLKNGSEEVTALVAATTLSLRRLFKEMPIAFFDFVCLCKDREYEFFDASRKALKDAMLLESDGSVHSSIKNIVLSSIEGEGMKMILVSPIKEEVNAS